MFDGYHFMLDRGASMFETLALVSAEEASKPVSSQSASLAAQVNHVCFYMEDVINQQEEADWAGSWRIGAVTDAEWLDLIARLRSQPGASVVSWPRTTTGTRASHQDDRRSSPTAPFTLAKSARASA